MPTAPKPAISAFLFLTILVCGASCSSERTDHKGTNMPAWHGERRIQDGVEYVRNPSDPLLGQRRCRLDERWRLPSTDSLGNPLFGAVSDISLGPDGNLYMTDYLLQRIHVVSPGGEYLRSIGSRGEGPGEFDVPISTFPWREDSLIVLDGSSRFVVIESRTGSGKSAQFSNHGAQWAAFDRGVPVCESLLACVGTLGFARKDGWHFTRVLAFFDRLGHLRSRYDALTFTIPRGPYSMTEVSSAAIPRSCSSPDGLVYIAPSFSEYRLHAVDCEGNLVRVIDREHEHVRRQSWMIEQEEEEMRHTFTRAKEVTASPFFREIQEYAWIEGTLWVCPSSGFYACPDGVALTWDVFDASGVFVSQVLLLGNLDPWWDTPFLLDARTFIIIKGNTAADMAAKGTASGKEPAYEGDLTIICYDILDTDAVLSLVSQAVDRRMKTTPRVQLRPNQGGATRKAYCLVDDRHRPQYNSIGVDRRLRVGEWHGARTGSPQRA